MLQIYTGSKETYTWRKRKAYFEYFSVPFSSCISTEGLLDNCCTFVLMPEENLKTSIKVERKPTIFRISRSLAILTNKSETSLEEKQFDKTTLKSQNTSAFSNYITPTVL